MLHRIKKSNNPHYLIWCFIITVWLCIAQIIGTSLLIVPCLLCFLFLVTYASIKGFIFPILLFFLPWSPLLKLEPGGLSFYTFALGIVCVIYLLRKRLALNVYCALLAIPIFMITLISRTIEGAAISNSYILFIFLLFLFPAVVDELKYRTDFLQLVTYFSIGIISAALSSQQLVIYSNIARYIDVYVWNVVTRLSGYYSDPNFYSAQISAALSGVMLLIIKAKEQRKRIFLIIMALVLLYCGLLSASKSFIITIGFILVIWLLRILTMRGSSTGKLLLVIGVAVAVVVVISSDIFSDLWAIVSFRFQQSDNLSGLTTGRSEIWISYFDVLMTDVKLLLIGNGFVNAEVNGHASHNTIIQIIYQFGLIGAAFLAMWEYYFLRGALKRQWSGNIFTTDVIILIIGAFLPWLSLDYVFFDEFFLVPIFVVAGVLYIRKLNVEP